MMGIKGAVLVCGSLLLWMATAVAGVPAKVESFRYWTAPDHTRLVFDISAPQPYHIFPLQNPDRLVIDVSNTELAAELPKLPADHPLLRRIRSASRDNNILRVVLDLKTGVKPKSFFLKPNEVYGHRLAVDLYGGNVQSAGRSAPVPNTPIKTVSNESRDVVIAIDAGHGGDDPGAKGPRGTREKDVVLAIAKRLYALLSRQPGMRPVLIREGDYYIGLRERIARARAAKADMFVSIHADAFKNPRVRGSSVFTLSSRGASSEAARWLAAKENAADLVGGVSLVDKEDLLASVLLDLSMTATQEASQQVAKNVLGHLKGLGRVHHAQVQKARFVVLKSPDIPSILVETAFISNPQEELNLRNPAHQNQVARAIFNGILEHFAIHAPPGTRLAVRRHVIERGETLSEIAQRYGVTTRQLQARNDLSDSRIRVGQILEIPSGG